MEGMNEQPKKNPWGEGDRYERELKEDPVEYARMLLERRISTQNKELEKRRVAYESMTADQQLGEILRISRLQEQIRYCETLLRRPDMTLRDHYGLDTTGRIVEYKKRALPDILSLDPENRATLEHTADHVRRSASFLEHLYPEIRFVFDQTPNGIEYTATLRALQQ